MEDFHHQHHREIYDNHQHIEEMQRIERERQDFERRKKNLNQNEISNKETSSSFIALAGIAFCAIILFASLGGTGFELAFPLICLIVVILAPLFKSENKD